MGRPRKNLKSADYPQIEQWATHGVSERDIASRLGMSPVTWRKVKERDLRARDALARGRGREETILVGCLYRAAVEKGNVTAAIFLLKTRHGYIDNPKPEMQESRVSVEVRLPAALSTNQYKQVLDITPKKALTEARLEVEQDAA